jgi:hypothetical protein
VYSKKGTSEKLFELKQKVNGLQEQVDKIENLLTQVLQVVKALKPEGIEAAPKPAAEATQTQTENEEGNR